MKHLFYWHTQPEIDRPLAELPYANNPNGKRVEVRFGDSAGNPYFTFAAMLMAGIDGIRNKIHPGDAMDKDLYDLPESELSGIPTVASATQRSTC